MPGVSLPEVGWRRYRGGMTRAGNQRGNAVCRRNARAEGPLQPAQVLERVS